MGTHHGAPLCGSDLHPFFGPRSGPLKIQFLSANFNTMVGQEFVDGTMIFGISQCKYRIKCVGFIIHTLSSKMCHTTRSLNLQISRPPIATHPTTNSHPPPTTHPTQPPNQIGSNWGQTKGNLDQTGAKLDQPGGKLEQPACNLYQTRATWKQFVPN